MTHVSISAVSPAPPVPLPATATPADLSANDAAFQLSLVQTGAGTAVSATPDYNTLPAAQASAGTATDAFAPVPVNTAIDPPWSTLSDSITFATHLGDTGIGVSSASAPNPFGTTLPGLALGSLASAAPAQPNPLAQLGLGIHLSALG
jgi:hypothetical protein